MPPEKIIIQINNDTDMILIDTFLSRNTGTGYNVLTETLGKDRLITLVMGRQRLMFLVDRNMFSFFINAIYNDIREQQVIHHMGLYLGSRARTRHLFVPSLILGSTLLDKGLARRNIVKIKDHAVKLFTYGKDLFACSIIDVSNPVEKNSWLLVIDEYEEFIGWGLALVDMRPTLISETSNACNKVVIKNMLDIGMYLRCESTKCSPEVF